jgi:hypothetical protein
LRLSVLVLAFGARRRFEHYFPGPRIFNLDFALTKSFYIRDKTRLQFRTTMANALNHPNFAVPRPNISSRGTLGTIASQVRVLNGSPSPREIDLGLRVEF